MSKYRNIPTGGYSSKREANRAAQLGVLARLGEVFDLQSQVKFELIPKQGKERPVIYIADFVYKDSKGNLVCEDSKGFRTRDYVIKRKLMLWVHGITITEV